MNQNIYKNQKGFSATELLVVIAIIAIIFAVVIPNIALSQAKKNLPQVRYFVTLYAGDKIIKEYLVENYTHSSSWPFIRIHLTNGKSELISGTYVIEDIKNEK